MLTITDAAWQRLAVITSSKETVNELRLIYRDGRVKCGRGVRRATDQVLERPDGTVLLVRSDDSQKLSARTLDTKSTPRGPRLRLCPIDKATPKEKI